MQATQSTAPTETLTPAILAPHLLTQAEFAAAAQVIRLVDHGRKWDVRYGKHSGFSDAETPEAALIDVHHAFLNNALYFNEPDAPEIHDKPSVPTRAVLADYPDLVIKFAHVLKASSDERVIVLPALSKAEYDAVLAGLRLLGNCISGGLVGNGISCEIGDILTDSETHEGLTSDEVHGLGDFIQDGTV